MTDQQYLRRRLALLERLQAERIEKIKQRQKEVDDLLERKQREIDNLRAHLTFKVVK